MRHLLIPRLLILPLFLWVRPGTSGGAAAEQTDGFPAAVLSARVQQQLDEAKRYMEAHQLEEALRADDRAFALAHEDGDRIGLARTLRGRAIVLEHLGRGPEAMAAWQEAAQRWEEAGKSPERVEALGRAAVLLGVARPAAATAQLDAVLALGRAETARPLAAASALASVGRGAYTWHHLDLARRFVTAALEIQEKRIPGSLPLAGSLDYLSAITGEQGDLIAAVGFCQRSLGIRERLAPVSLDTATVLGNLGMLARMQGDMDHALANLRRALDIQRKLAPEFLFVANSLDSLGAVRAEQGDLMAAQDFMDQGLAIREKREPGSMEVARSLGNLGNLAFREGDLEAARDLYHRTLAILNQLAPNSPDLATCFNALGAIATARGDLAASRDYHQQALSIQERVAPGWAGVAYSLAALGRAAALQGDLPTARDLLQRALALNERMGPGSMEVARGLDNLADVAEQQGDLAGARTLLQRAQSLLEKLAPESLDMANNAQSLGLVLIRQGDLAAAEPLMQRAWRLVRTQAPAVIGDEARQAFTQWNTVHNTNLIAAEVALGKSKEAFQTLEEGRAQALQQLLLEHHASLRGVEARLWRAYVLARAALGRAEQRLAAAGIRVYRARSALEAVSPTATAADREQLRANQDQAVQQQARMQTVYTRARLDHERAWSAVWKNAPRAFPGLNHPGPVLQGVPSGTLYVAFAVHDAQSFLFLLPSGANAVPQVYHLPVQEEELGRSIQEFVAAVKGQDLELAVHGRALFAQLFPPPARLLLQKARRLLISPDGPLWDLPFAALVTNSSGPPSYLGLEKPLTSSPSLTLFDQCQREPPRLAPGQKPTVLVMGDPRFAERETTPASRVPTIGSRGSSRERSLLLPDARSPAALPGTGAEAGAVARLYGCRPLLGPAATEAALRRQIGVADVIHLASHGYLHPYRAMSSGVLLSMPEGNVGNGDSRNDGALLAWEVRDQLSLRAEIVVLSGCETGKGEKVRGEGVLGMARALQYAGARSILASLWQVRDESTAELMIAFHRNLRAGLAKDEALLRAMRRVASDPGTARPYFWAPFFLTGDPANPNLGARPTRPPGRRRSPSPSFLR